MANPHKESLQRVLAQMGGLGRTLKTEQLRGKYGGPIPGSDPAAKTAPGEEGPDEGAPEEEAAESPTEEALEEESGDSRAELMELSPERIRALLEQLKG